MRVVIVLLIAVLLALATIYLRRTQPAPVPTASSAAADTNRQVYRVRGIIQEIEPDRTAARIQHDEIPGYMRAMTMSLDVKNTNELRGLKPSDIVMFDMVVTPEDAWIEKVLKIGEQKGPAPEPIRVTRDVAELKEGDPLPNYRFTDQLGQEVELREFRGRALALAFFYTRCPYPDFCPRTSRNLAETVKLLAARPDGPTNWHVLSLSFDPGFDTVEALKTYSEQYQADPQRWSFLTGSIEDIDAITEQFGVTISRGENLTWNHNLRTVVVDARGRIQKIIAGNQWQPAELAAELRRAAAP